MKPDLHAGAFDDAVGRQDRLAALARDGVRRDVGVARAPHEAQRLGAALVELVVAQRAHVEAHQVGGLDRRLVLEVARDERGGTDHVARVHANGALGVRELGAVEPRAEPRGATHMELGRLEVAVQVVDPEQLKLDRPGAVIGPGLLRARRQAQQRNEKSGREGGRSREQVAAVDGSHGATLGSFCRAFVNDPWRCREGAVNQP